MVCTDRRLGEEVVDREESLLNCRRSLVRNVQDMPVRRSHEVESRPDDKAAVEGCGSGNTIWSFMSTLLCTWYQYSSIVKLLVSDQKRDTAT